MAKQQRRAHQRGQSVLEYLLVVAALIGAIVAVTKPNGTLDKAFKDMGTKATAAVESGVAAIGTLSASAK